MVFFPISNPSIRWRNMVMSVDKTMLQRENQDAAQKELDNPKNLNKRSEFQHRRFSHSLGHDIFRP